MDWTKRYERLHGADVIDVSTWKGIGTGLNPHPGFDILSMGLMVSEGLLRSKDGRKKESYNFLRTNGQKR